MSTEHPHPAASDAGADRLGYGAGRVWLSAQRSPTAQRRGLLVPESIAHPARMLPDLAAHIIATYSRPGELVLDPMCGIGTTVVQAVRAGRRAAGIELESRWVRIAEENLALARADGFGVDARIVRGDARTTHHLIAEHSPDRPVSLLVTSPPYGAGVHGQITNRHAADPIIKSDHRYASTRSRANLAHTPHSLGESMTAILRSAARVLRPGGHVVVVTRPWRHRGTLVDLPGQIAACADAAGLVPTDRAVSLLARLDHPAQADARDAGPQPPAARLVARPSFFARHNMTVARAAGQPVHLIAHEDVSVFTRPEPGEPR